MKFRKRLVLVLCVSILCIPAVQAMAAPTPGSTVLAWWAQGEAWFVGTVVEPQGGGFLVVFEDGDQAVVPAARIKALDIRVGSPVLALWSDKKFYPGTVARIVGRALYIHFDDGDKGWTSWAGIAVK